MNWTDSQNDAINIPVSDIIISAAAGSGKTAVMAERIITRLTGENHVDIDKILVVTYTNAAASEIKERVMGKIVNKMKESNDATLQNQLVLMGNAHFCTIHSFCLELIKKYFYKLGIDPQVKTGDPADVKVVFEQAISNVFNEYFANKDKDFENIVDAYANGREETFLSYISDIYNFSRTMPDSIAWLDSFVNFYQNNTDVIFECVVNQAVLSLEYAKEELEKAVELINQTNCCTEWLGNINFECNSIVTALSNKNDIYKLCDAVLDIVFNRVPASKSANNSETKEIIKSFRGRAKKAVGEATELMSSFKSNVENNYKERSVPIVKKIVEITKKVSAEFDLLKRKKNFIDFSDYEHMALKLLKNPDGTPSDIARSVADGFEEIYIDEYQDCNNIQNEIFKYISGAIYGNPNLFCVGDMKQSIYKFRDANPLNFKNRCDNSEIYDSKKLNNSNKILLNSNFRSRKSILDYVNNSFYQLMTTTCGELEYSKDEALSYGADFKDYNDDANCIDIDIINESDDFGEGCILAEEKRYSKQDAEVMHIAKKIKNMVESGYILNDKKKENPRKISYGDIAVLFRSPADYVSSVEKIFGELKIPHICDAGGDFFDTPEVSFIVSLLKIIDNPDDDISIVAVLKNPIFGFDENMFLKIKMASYKKSFYNSILDYINNTKDDVISSKLSDFINKLNDYHNKSKYTELSDFILYLISDLNYFAYLATFSDSELKKNNIRILISKAVEFEKESFKGIFSFINYIDNIAHSKNDISSKSVGESDDVVRIMSIHKSKGLEFPVVFLSGTGKKYNMTDTTGRILLHKDLGIGIEDVNYEKSFRVPTINKLAIKHKIKCETMSEELRVLYVALTRPTEKLIITGVVSEGSAFLNGIQAKLCTQPYKINPYLIINSKRYLETILLASMRSENFEDAYTKRGGLVNSDGVLYNVNLINKNEIKFISPVSVKSAWKDSFESVTDDYDNIVLGFNTTYPYTESYDIPGNLSVTEIKKLANSSSDEFNYYDDTSLEKPVNFACTKGISGNVLGTLMHLCMEKFDLSNITSEDDIIVQLNQLVDLSVISAEERKFVDSCKIYKFYTSEIGKRILAHTNSLNREFSFKYLENASDILNVNTNDRIVVQGTIDLFFVDDDDSIVLVDYKTDKIKGDNVQDVVSAYTVQLECYARALEKILHKKVKEKVIYLFDADKAVWL